MKQNKSHGQTWKKHYTHIKRKEKPLWDRESYVAYLKSLGEMGRITG